jgi:hypothetical protein
MKLPKVKMPNVKMPSVGKKAGEAKRGGLKTPAFAEDLYRDMRDRRLILPAAALVVAIIAVPVLLKAPAEEPPIPPAFTPPEGSEAVAPAVLAEAEVGVRDYRKRLDALKSKNPFASKFKLPDEQPGLAVDPSASATPADSGVAPAGATSAATGSSTPDTSPTPAPSGGGGGGGEVDEILIVAPRLDVRIGRKGETKKMKDVEIGDILPHPRKAPMVVFLGTDEKGKFADFLVSSDVASTDGDGRCRPSPDNCEFLRMKKGQKQVFVFGEDGARRSITITDIRVEVVDRRKASSG